MHHSAPPYSYSPLCFSSCQSSSVRASAEIGSEWHPNHQPLRFMSSFPVFWAAGGGHLNKGSYTLGAANSLAFLGSVASQLKHLAAWLASARSHRNCLQLEGVTRVAIPSSAGDFRVKRNEIKGLHGGTYIYRIIATKFKEYNRLQTTSIHRIAGLWTKIRIIE